MKLLFIQLQDNYRLMLNGTRSISIHPKEVVQLILGTNGSGKSSLIREVFPFPAEAKDYTATGFKEVHYSHKGSVYKLRSSFSPQTHSFEKDGVELNQGGTQRVQNELVKQEFGLTPAIRDLLVGATRFHAMSPLARRDLFTQMNDTDFTYGLGIFNKLREALRDVSGALKLAKNRLAIETAKIITKEERARFQKRAVELHEAITQIINVRTPISTSSREYEQVFHQILTQIATSAERLLVLDLVLPEGFTHLEGESELTASIIQIKEQIRLADEHNEQLIKEYRKVSEDVKLLKSTGGESVPDLRSKVKALGEQAQQLHSKLKGSWRFEDPEQARRALESVEEELQDIFSRIQQNDEGQFSSKGYQHDTEELQTSRKRLEELERTFQKFMTQKEHLEHHRDSAALVCPKCSHSWILGFDQHSYDQLLTWIEEYTGLTKETRERIQTLTERVETSGEYFSLYRRYISLKDRWSVLKPFWEACDAEGLSYRFPRLVLDQIKHLKEDFLVYQDIQAKEKEQTRVSMILSALEQADLVEVRRSEERVNAIAQELEDRTVALQRHHAQLKNLQSYQSRLQSALRIKTEVTELLGKAQQNWQGFTDALRMEDVHAILREYQSELAATEDILSQISIQVALIVDLKGNIESLEKEELALKVLIKELSPTEGLIAEGMLGFINSVTGQMNHIISTIWSYELEILPCTFNEDTGTDLDYRFPMRIASVPRPIPDIVAGSVGQREITDLAFKIVAAKCLGLEEMPLFLDEFGAGFDVKHRGSSMQAIRNLINQLDFPQVFMVSHYESSYGSLSNVDICVLCPDNVTIPETFNTHVEFA